MLAMVLTRHAKGPTWAMAVTWLFCMFPILIGAVEYGFFDDDTVWYALTLMAFIGSYFLGGATWRLLPRSPFRRPDAAQIETDFLEGHATAKLAWWIGIIGASLYIADFFFGGGAGLDDLAALREAVVGSTGASVVVRIASVMTWACLYCFIFALSFDKKLKRLEYIRMLVPIAGYFMLSVISAGRQAAFQLILVTTLTFTINRARRFAEPNRPSQRGSLSAYLAAFGLFGALTTYMGYIAIARNDNAISDEKGNIILALFDASFKSGLDRFLYALGSNARSATVEATVYFSSSVALFQNFLQVNFTDFWFGATSFPFLFRQIQSFTGIEPTAILADKIAKLNDSGVIGAGWTTAISSYIQDFGTMGAIFFLFLLGYYSQSAYERARISSDINVIVVAVVILLIAVYTPLVPASSDSNVFFLWVFALVQTWRIRLRENL